ncbi:ClpP-like prohead protease/major capsid protein fusion protein [Shewanella algae]|uniref:ClpP-like prohead protease/major capsid protein fusion protein n=1 Tax=Shewanella algae TaxID=38313 RepID=UPI000F4219F7|nr:ClpP-like prohead protease/major capsid protein fusion protein [Shewanella algae]AYV12368.1 Clp protease ClpP [Shewanella algae]
MKRTHLAAACATALTSAALIAPQGNGATPIKGKYEIKASAEGAVTLTMYGEVGWDFTAKSIARDIAAVPKVTSVTAYIQSGGGSVMDGFAIYNIIARMPVPKTLYVEAVAASMGSVIAMAFDKVIMPANAFLMVHSNWGGACGTAEDLRDYADLLDRWKESMAKAYRDKTKQPDEVINGWMSKDTWFSADEALAVGLADEVIEPIEMAASIDPKRLQEYDNMPDKLKALFAPQGNAGATTQQPAATVATTTQQQAVATTTQQLGSQPTQEQINAAAAELNRTRVDGLNTLFASWPQFAELKNECIADVEMTAEKAKDKILAKLGENTTPAAAQPSRVTIHAGNGNIVGDSIRAQLMARAGYAEREKDNGYTSYGLLELARASLTDRGISVAGYDKMGMVGLAFTHSSSDFGNILLDVSNKSVLMGWDQAEESFERIAYKGQLGDFKVARRIGLNEFGSLRQVREGAEYKHITTSDHGQSIALATYGEIFSITRQTIVNDDMDMLTRVPMMMGAAGKGTIGDLFWAVLTSNAKMGDGKALFHADHGNLGSGAPSVEALSAGRKNMRLQKSGGRNLNIRTEFVLCPVALEDTFNQIIKSTSVKGTDANSGVANPVKDMAEVIGEPRLDDHSAVEWYLAAGQGRDTIEVAYLDGIDKPYIEQLQGFNIDGIATKVRIDAGVAARDYRGLYKSSGQ